MRNKETSARPFAGSTGKIGVSAKGRAAGLSSYTTSWKYFSSPRNAWNLFAIAIGPHAFFRSGPATRLHLLEQAGIVEKIWIFLFLFHAARRGGSPAERAEYCVFQGYVMAKLPEAVRRVFHALGPVIVTCIFLGAVWLLYRQISKYSLAEIRESLAQVPPAGVVASLVLMVINYAILVGYDWLAIKGIHKKLSLPRVALVSFIGQAVSYNFGALLGGTTARYRFYSAWGFSPMDIVRLILMLAVTFWVGALGLVGTIFLIAPPEIPAELGVHLAIGVRPLGFLLFLVAASYLVACRFIHKPIHLFGREISFPPFRIAVAQAIVAGADLICAGACLYVLLPPDSGVSFIQFLPSYLMGMVLVVLSHVPGGVGVLEIVILHLSTADPKGVFAALICFRAIYYLIPLLAAAAIFAIYEIRYQSQHISVMHDVARWMRAYSPTLMAGVAFVSGIVLTFWAILPVSMDNLAMLEKLEPLPVLELSHMLAAMSGMLLLFLAPGIQHRKTVAVRLALLALIAGGICVELSTLHWPATLMCVVAFLCLFIFRRRATRHSTLWTLRASARWTLSALAIFFATAGLGIIIHHADSASPTLWLAAGYTADTARLLRTLFAEGLLFIVLVAGYIRTMPLRRRRRTRAEIAASPR